MYTNIDNDLFKENLLKELSLHYPSHNWVFLYGYGIYCSNCNCRLKDDLKSCEEIRMNEALK